MGMLLSGGVILAASQGDVTAVMVSLINQSPDHPLLEDAVVDAAVGRASQHVSQSITLVNTLGARRRKPSHAYLVQRVAKQLVMTAPDRIPSFCQPMGEHADQCYEAAAVQASNKKSQDALMALMAIRSPTIKQRIIEEWANDPGLLVRLDWGALSASSSLDSKMPRDLRALLALIQAGSQSQFGPALIRANELANDKKNLALQLIGLLYVNQGLIPEGIATIRSIPNPTQRVLGFEKACVWLIQKKQVDEALGIQTTYVNRDSQAILQALALHYVQSSQWELADATIKRLPTLPLSLMSRLILESAKQGDIERAVGWMQRLPDTKESQMVAQQLGELSGLGSDFMFTMMHLGKLKAPHKETVMQSFARTYASQFNQYDRVAKRMKLSATSPLLQALLSDAIQANELSQLPAMIEGYQGDDAQWLITHIILELAKQKRPLGTWPRQLSLSKTPDLGLMQCLAYAQVAWLNGQPQDGNRWLDRAKERQKDLSHSFQVTGLRRICELMDQTQTDAALTCRSALPIPDQIRFLAALPDWATSRDVSGWLPSYQP